MDFLNHREGGMVFYQVFIWILSKNAASGQGRRMGEI
jgi:hypothetical protein